MRIFTIALAALALLPAGAQAREANAAPTVRVSYADLNLDSAEGVRALDRRLAQAARAVCADHAADTQLARQLSVRRCIAQTRKELSAARDHLLAGRSAPIFVASAAN